MSAPAPGDPCPACEGTGLAQSRRFHCWQCHGTGRVQDKQYYWTHREPPPGQPAAAEPAAAEPAPAELAAAAAAGPDEEPICPRCQGSGVSASRTRHCSACLGSGRVRPRTSGWQ